jgi:methylmalonyl-CoA mutase N-terminal domain/subunit
MFRTAKTDGPGFLINGSKTSILNRTLAQFAIAHCQTAPDAKPNHRRQSTLVETNRKDLQIMDANYPRAQNEVGLTGVCITDIHDMETLTASIPLDRLYLTLSTASTVAVTTVQYVVVQSLHCYSHDEALCFSTEGDMLRPFAHNRYTLMREV